MTELIIWIANHPNVKVRLYKDSILDSLVIRVIKGRYISEHMMDALECQLYFSANEKQRTDFMIGLLDRLYDNLEEVEDD